MNEKKDLKLAFYNLLLEIVNRKIEDALKSIDSTKESRDNETKSSVGDKYETGRTMMQFELEKNNVQLNKAIQLKNELAQIDFQKKYTQIEFGSLVLTDKDNYFISIGLGKIEINNQTCYSISLASPFGKIIYNKRVGDKIKFQDKEIAITEIV